MSGSLEVSFQAIAEDQPGEKWLACYERTSPNGASGICAKVWTACRPLLNAAMR